MTFIPKVEVSKAALTLLGGTDSFLLPFTTSWGAADGDVPPGDNQFPVSTLSPQLSTSTERVPGLLLPMQVEFVTGFGTPIPADLVENWRSPG